jgi:hypothetical protein
MMWGLLTHSTTTLNGDAVLVQTGLTSANAAAASVAILVSGLTPGNAYQWDWGFASPQGAGTSVKYGGGSAGVSTSDFGPAIMEVWSA